MKSTCWISGNRAARWAAVTLGLLMTLGALERAGASERAAWMREARWGVMTHYLADWIASDTREPMTVERWNQLVEAFDVERVAQQLEEVGAGYYLISIGQNSGYYLSPNETYDRFVGIRPSKLARRDLVADLHEALQRRGIRLMVYLPSGAPNGDREARTALEWQNGPHRNREFQLKWEQVIAEWSERWGDKVSGWWFDGCYWPNTMYRTEEAPNFKSFAAAARVGNPDRALAFCPGVVYRTLSITPHEDYIAGEVSDPTRWDPNRNIDGKIDGAQVHALSYLGRRWGRGEPRFASEEHLQLSRRVMEAAGVMTWDVPTLIEGGFAPEFIAQMKAINEIVRSTEPAPPRQRRAPAQQQQQGAQAQPPNAAN